MWDGALSRLNSQILGRSFRTSQSPQKATEVCGLGCLVCHHKFFVNNNNLLHIKKNYEHSLDFALHLSRLLRFRWVWTFRIRFMPSSQNVCLITARVSAALFLRFVQNSLTGSIAKSHLDSYTSPNERKNQNVHLAAVLTFYTLTPRLCQYCHVSLHRTITTAVLMVAPVPENMDIQRMTYTCC
jgi:hypothetical protein